MISVQGRPTPGRDGIGRREILRAGALSLFGMSLDRVLKAEAATAARGKAKSVILLYLFGGPSIHETFDPKPDAPVEYRGEFGSTPTSVPGVHFCEHLPKMAKWMHRSTLIRSAGHNVNEHDAGSYYALTGMPPDAQQALTQDASKAPSLSAVFQYLARDESRSLPASVWMPCPTGWGEKMVRPGPYAGYLGGKYDPLFTTFETEALRVPKDYPWDGRTFKGRIRLPDAILHPDLKIDRLQGRRELLADLQRQAGRLGASEAYERFDAFHKKAFDILTDTAPDSPWRAFDLDEEPSRVQEAYGRNIFGQSTLTARRLIERGARFVTASWDTFSKLGGDSLAWDTHWHHFPIYKNNRLPELDHAYSALCADLQSRGLLDETLVVVMGEMGRTPKINNNKGGGRDHWSYLQNVLLTGAGVQQGMVYGSSDKKGQMPESNPVGPADLIATIYAALGIDPSTLIQDQAGRLRPILADGEPIRKILA